jgi:hypothetical protein
VRAQEVNDTSHLHHIPAPSDQTLCVCLHRIIDIQFGETTWGIPFLKACEPTSPAFAFGVQHEDLVLFGSFFLHKHRGLYLRQYFEYPMKLRVPNVPISVEPSSDGVPSAW